MKIDTFEKLYHDLMSTTKNGHEQIQEFLPAILSVVTNFDLRNRIREAMAEIREQTGRMERYLPETIVAEQGDVSPGMRGLIGECHRFLERASDPAIIDAGIAVGLQKIFHVAIASHSALRNYAILLNRETETDAFQETLDELSEAERELRRLALEEINVEALGAASRAS